MKKLLLALLLTSAPAWAQNIQCPTRTAGDSSNACASTAFVTGAITIATTLTNAHIFVGNASNVATDVAMSGDVTISNAGVTTLASVISAGGPSGSATAAPIITYDAKGRLTAVTTATITPAIGSITGLGTGVATAAAINLGSAGALAGTNVAQTFTSVQTFSANATGSLVVKRADGAGSFALMDTPGAGQQSGFNLADNATIKWQFIKQTDNTFLIYDAVNAIVMATYNPGAVGAGFISYANTTAATSTTTGALRTAGGLGVAGDGYAVNLVGTTSLIASSATNGITITQAAVTRNNAAGNMTFASGTNAGTTFQLTGAGGTSQAQWKDGHWLTANTTAPALTSCGGGSPTISGTDHAGTVTMGTTATGCVITFATAYLTAPHCTVTWRATPLASQSFTVSTAAITLTQTSTSSNLIDYICFGLNAG